MFDRNRGGCRVVWNTKQHTKKASNTCKSSRSRKLWLTKKFNNCKNTSTIGYERITIIIIKWANRSYKKNSIWWLPHIWLKVNITKFSLVCLITIVSLLEFRISCLDYKSKNTESESDSYDLPVKTREAYTTNKKTTTTKSNGKKLKILITRGSFLI